MPNKKLENIAQKVIDNIPNDSKDDNFGFVITILMIISIVLTLIRVIQECNKKITLCSATERYNYFQSEIKQRSSKKSWFTKMIVKKTIRKEIGNDNYKKYGVDIMNSIFKTAENLTDDEIKTLVEATNV